MIKTIQVLCAIVITSVSMSSYSQPSTESILRYFEVTKTKQLLDTMYQQSGGQVRGMILQQDKWPDGYTDEKKVEVANKVATMTEDFMREKLGWPVLEETFVELYSKHFTEKEIQDAIAFYETESGQSMNEKIPAVTAEAMQKTLEISQQLGPDLEKMIVDYLSTLE